MRRIVLLAALSTFLFGLASCKCSREATPEEGTMQEEAAPEKVEMAPAQEQPAPAEAPAAAPAEAPAAAPAAPAPAAPAEAPHAE